MKHKGMVIVRISVGVRDYYGGRGPVINGVEHVVEEEDLYDEDGRFSGILPDLPPLKIGDQVEVSSDSGLSHCQGVVIKLLPVASHRSRPYRGAVIDGSMRVPTRRWLEAETESRPTGETNCSVFYPFVGNSRSRWTSLLWEGALTLDEARKVLPPKCGETRHDGEEIIRPSQIRKGWPGLKEDFPEVGTYWSRKVVVPENHQILVASEATTLRIDHPDGGSEYLHDRFKIGGKWHKFPAGKFVGFDETDGTTTVYLDVSVNPDHHRTEKED